MISVYTDKNCTDESLLIENFALKANEATEIPVNIPAYVDVYKRQEQYLINHDKQFAGPIGIELTAEILVGVECYIVLKEADG